MMGEFERRARLWEWLYENPFDSATFCPFRSWAARSSCHSQCTGVVRVCHRHGAECRRTRRWNWAEICLSVAANWKLRLLRGRT